MKHFFALPLGCLLAAPALAQTPATFTAVATYSTGGTNPDGVSVADVNGDGRPDLLTTNYTSGTAGVLLGTGTGTFGTATTYGTGANSSPYGIAVADVNGDGKVDILTANSTSNTAGVLLGTSTGTFSPIAVYSTGANSSPDGITVADVNADGRPDLLTANYGNSTAGVLLGTGTGTFGAVAAYGTGSNSSPVDVAVADVNADGRPDLLTANFGSGTVGVLLGTGTGSFGVATTYSAGSGSSPSGIAVADVNGDGKPDILTANDITGTTGVLLGTGTGTFGTVTTYSTGGSRPGSIVVADVSGDGKRDIVVVNFGSNTVGVLLGTGTGTFGAVTTYSSSTGSSPVDIAVADVNGDGKPDLLTANRSSNTLGVLLNTSTFLPTRAALPGSTTTLFPSPIRAGGSATLTATGLPDAARTLGATLLDVAGRPVRRLTVPATAGAATGSVPTAGLAAGLYSLQLSALDAQGAALGELPVQRLSVE